MGESTQEATAGRGKKVKRLPNTICLGALVSPIGLTSAVAPTETREPELGIPDQRVGGAYRADKAGW